MGGSRGGDDRGSGPLENHKNIGFLCNTGPDPLKNHDATRQAFNFRPLSQASRCQQMFSKPCLVSLISKDTHLVFSISHQASRCQQTFSKPCLVNLISKDTHLVFSISRQASQCQAPKLCMSQEPIMNGN